MKLNELIADEQLLANGKWFTFNETHAEPAEFLLAYAGSDKFTNMFEEAQLREQQRHYRNKQLPALRVMELWFVLANGRVIKDWRGIKNTDGSDFKFNDENYKKLFGASTSNDLRTWIVDTCANQKNFMLEDTPDDETTPSGRMKSSPEVSPQAGERPKAA
jgi:hypothetical protein